MSNWLTGIIDGVIGAARGILTIRIVSVTRQTERENEIYREGFDEGHRIGVLNGKARKIDAAPHEELEVKATERVDVAPDSIRPGRRVGTVCVVGHSSKPQIKRFTVRRPGMSNNEAIEILENIETGIYGKIAIAKAIDALRLTDKETILDKTT